MEAWSRALRRELSAIIEFRDGDPGPLLPRIQASFSELNALGAFQQVPRERIVLHDVPQEEFPLALKGVVERVLLRHFLPALEIIQRALDIGVPDRARRGAVWLN